VPVSVAEAQLRAKAGTRQRARLSPAASWTHRASVVVVAAVIVAVFFLPRPHVSLFRRIVRPTKSPPTATVLSPKELLRLAYQGLSGNFEATYKVTGDLPIYPGPTWTVVIAHRGPSSSKDWMLDGGQWSYLLRAGRGYEQQWIEQANHYQECWRQGPGKWTCGKGTAFASNGFILQTLPYIPGTVDGDIAATVQNRLALGQGEHQGLSVFSQPSHKFGTLSCLKETSWITPKRKGATVADKSATTWCLTDRGLPVNEHQQGSPETAFTWDDLTLLSARQIAPESDFRPLSAHEVQNGLPRTL